MTLVFKKHNFKQLGLWASPPKPWSRWATAAEDHTGCHSCQLRTGNGGYNSHRLTNIGQQKIGKTLPGLMSLDFCCDIQMVGSEFGVKTWKHGSILPCLNGSGWWWWWWCNGAGDIFLAHFGPLSTNWASFKCHSLPECCCWSCPSLYEYSVAIFWCYFQQDNAPCHKAQIISDWFLEHDNEFTLLKWPPQSSDLNPIEQG